MVKNSETMVDLLRIQNHMIQYAHEYVQHYTPIFFEAIANWIEIKMVKIQTEKLLNN
jgi:hypothetical protein